MSENYLLLLQTANSQVTKHCVTMLSILAGEEGGKQSRYLASMIFSHINAVIIRTKVFKLRITALANITDLKNC